MELKKIKIYIDIIFCCIVLPIIFTLVPVDRWILRYPVFAVILLLFLYTMYFAIRYSRLPQKFLNHQYIYLVIFAIVSTGLAYCVSNYPISPDPTTSAEDMMRQVRIRYRMVWFLFLIVSGYSLSISLIFELFRQSMLKREIEEKRQAAELTLYKAQINPHFFFNTLNTLYGLTISKSELAEDAFVRFIELMKFSYSRINEDFISIAEEIQYLKNYIELQKLRLNGKTKVNFTCSVDDESIIIPPMLLISFVENAFKFGSSSKKNCDINIHIKMYRKNFNFECDNEIITHGVQTTDTPVGVENTRSRLNILYPYAYSLQIYESDNRYHVKLSISLK